MLNYLKKIILVIGDVVIIHLSLLFTLYLRYGKENIGPTFNSHWPSFIIIFLIWFLVFYINNLYDLNQKINKKTFLYTIINSIIISFFLSILYFYLNTNPKISPKTNLILFSVIFTALFLSWHYLFQIITHSILPKSNLAIIGDNKYTQKIIEEINKHPSFEYQVSVIFKDTMELEKLNTYIKEKKLKAILIVDTFNNNKKIQQILFDCLKYNLSFYNYPDFYENLTGKIPVEAIDPNWFIANLKERQKQYYSYLKQFLDYILSILILVITLPFYPFIALGIKLTSPGPIFFTQLRLGLHGQSFRIIKFRTMKIKDNDQSPTTTNDNRVTKFGLFLRKTRIDELPQVINILRNDMSFIGPRPERLDIAINLERKIPFYRTRLLVKPGLSGWDQISGSYHSSSPPDSLEKLQYDLYYLKHRSLYLDLSIALRTIATILSRKGI